MTKIEPLTPDRFPEVYSIFLKDDDPRVGEDDWRRLFNERTCHEEGHCGYILTDAGVVVGMLGMIFSERDVDSRTEKFCNLHSWYVKEEFRGRSLLLMRPALKLADYTLTDFTPTPDVCRIAERLGFVHLDATLRVLLPGFLRDSESNPRCYWDNEVPVERLTAAERHLHSTHEGTPIGRLLVANEKQTCYLLFRKIGLYWQPYCHIFYASSAEQFASWQRTIRNEVRRRTSARFLTVSDASFKSVRLPRSFRLPGQTQQLYRSSRLRAEQVDQLFSEVSLLGISTMPGISGPVRRFARRARSAAISIVRVQKLLSGPGKHSCDPSS